MQLRPIGVDEESCSLPPGLHLHGKQPRTPRGLLGDAGLFDLPVQLVNVIDADAAHEGTLLGHEIGEREELQSEFPAAQNQPAIVPMSQPESEPS